MQIRSIVTGFFLCCAFCSLAETPVFNVTDTLKSPRYFNSLHFGGLAGAKGAGTTPTVATFHGVALHKWRLGLGIGYDNYDRWTVVPMYGMFSVDIARLKKNRLYLTLAAGYNKPHRNGDDETFVYKPSSATTVSPLVGYRIQSGKWNINFQAGYKWQRVGYTFERRYWLAIGTKQPEYEVVEMMERLVIHVGFGFN